MKKKLPLIDGVEPACERCAFSSVPEDDDPMLTCLRYPPLHARQHGFGTDSDYYPFVHPDLWCGEFRKAEYEEEAKVFLVDPSPEVIEAAKELAKGD